MVLKMIMLRGRNNGISEISIEDMKNKEAPQFIEGRLLRPKPIRHKMPRTNFYYSNEEWFKETTPKTGANTGKSREVSGSSSGKSKSHGKSLSNQSSPKESHRQPASATSALPKISPSNESQGSNRSKPNQKRVIIDADEVSIDKDFDSNEYNEYKIRIPTKVYADSYIRRDAAKWKSTPVPGFRTCTFYDQYRRETLKHYDDVYDRHRGVVPKYGGYVPGLKFRYGSTFGQLTHNAREIGVETNKSRTWGGAVSLF